MTIGISSSIMTQLSLLLRQPDNSAQPRLQGIDSPLKITIPSEPRRRGKRELWPLGNPFRVYYWNILADLFAADFL